MGKLNPKNTVQRFDTNRLAAGAGQLAARSSNADKLRRLVMANLLFEQNFYSTGLEAAQEIAELIPKCAAAEVASIAIEARAKQKLRHVPLFIGVHMLRYDETLRLAAHVFEQVCTRPDQITDAIALYLSENKIKANSKWTLPRQMKLGLSAAFAKFNEYQLAKYDRKGKRVSLVGALRIIHACPRGQEQADLWRRLIEGKLATPNTWEVALSSGRNKNSAWTELLQDKTLGDLAFLRNIRNMQEAGVSVAKIIQRLGRVSSKDILPLDFLKAEKYAPTLSAEIGEAMLRCYDGLEKLPGTTVLVIDVSGSMTKKLSGKSEFTRMEVATALLMLARARAERAIIVATAGSDGSRTHKSKLLPNLQGFGLRREVQLAYDGLGGGGIFTRQALEWAQEKVSEPVDRVIVLSDSQDMDRTNTVPRPFGRYNYIIDVSAEKLGVNYKGVWTAEVSGWSEHFIDFIAASEGLTAQGQEQ